MNIEKEREKQKKELKQLEEQSNEAKQKIETLDKEVQVSIDEKEQEMFK